MILVLANLDFFRDAFLRLCPRESTFTMIMKYHHGVKLAQQHKLFFIKDKIVVFDNNTVKDFVTGHKLGEDFSKAVESILLEIQFKDTHNQ